MRREETSNSYSYHPSRDGSRSPLAVEFLGLALLGLALFAAFNIIEVARWFNNLPPLVIPILLSLALAHLLLRRGAPWKVHLPAVLGLGLAVALGLGLWRLSGGAAGGMGIFILALSAWTSYFTLLLAYRSPSPVLLVLPGLLVMVISLAFLPSDYFFRLPLFLLASAPAIAHFHLQRWGGGSRLALRLAPLAAGLALMGGAVAFTWSTPSPSDPIRPAAADRLLEEPIYDFWEYTADIFSKIPNRRDLTQFNLHPILPFTGPVAQGEDIIMVVKAQEPLKWRYRVYETYSKEGWSRIPKAERVDTNASPPPVETLGLLDREEVTIRVRLKSSNTHMASAGIPLEASISSLSEFSPTPSFSLDLTTDQSSYLPTDILDLRNRVLEGFQTRDEEFNLDQELNLAGLEVLAPESEASQEAALNSPLKLARVQDTVSPTTALMFSKRQSPPRSYVTIGSVSTANTLALREAAQEYPSWVTDRYLQLPPDFSQPIRDMALDLAASHDNPFDIAMGIQDFLHSLPYSTDVVAPPPGVDPVEWFITVQRVGFCNYYASAMITMLRSLGIPARLVVGFAPGDWDEQRDYWIVRSKHYHAWPEVYFSQYGWVEFEPTPPGVQPSLEQLGFTAPGPLDTNDLSFLGDEECFFDPLGCETFEPDTSLDDFDFSQFDRDNDLAAGPDGGSGGIPGFAIWVGSVLGLAAVAVLGAKLYMTYLNARLGEAAATYATMSAMACMGGVPRASHFTPSEFASRLAQRLPGQSDSIGQVVRTYEVSRYSRDKQVDKNQGEQLKASWKSLRWPLLRLIARRLLPRRFFKDGT